MMMPKRMIEAADDVNRSLVGGRYLFAMNVPRTGSCAPSAKASSKILKASIARRMRAMVK